MYLTQNEFNVLSFRLNGLTIQQISENMGISKTAVLICYNSLLDKYNVNDGVALKEKVNFEEIKISPLNKDKINERI